MSKITSANDASSGLFLLGNVGHLVIANVVKGGIQINKYPQGLSGKELADFFNGLEKNQEESVKSADTDETKAWGIARKAKFAYVGNCLLRGVQVDIPDGIAKASQELAEKILDMPKKDELNQASIDDAAPYTSDLPKLTGANSAKNKVIQQSDVFCITSANDIHTLKIRYGHLNQTQKEQLQPGLETMERNGDYVSNSIKRRGDNVISSLQFYELDTLEALCEKAWETLNPSAQTPPRPA